MSVHEANIRCFVNIKCVYLHTQKKKKGNHFNNSYLNAIKYDSVRTMIQKAKYWELKHRHNMCFMVLVFVHLLWKSSGGHALYLKVLLPVWFPETRAVFGLAGREGREEWSALDSGCLFCICKQGLCDKPRWYRCAPSQQDHVCNMQMICSWCQNCGLWS